MLTVQFTKDHLKEITALFKKNNVRFSPFLKVDYNPEVYQTNILRNFDQPVITALLLLDKIYLTSTD